MKLIYFLFLIFSLPAIAQDIPDPMSPPRLVNDFTQTLSPQQLQQLEQKLVAFDDSTSTQIAVVFIRSLEGYDVNQYGAELAEKWGIGQQDTRNGVVLLTSVDDRKVSIQVGYGLEPVITDALSKLIIEEDIIPSYRNGDYFRGVDLATDNLMQLAIGEFPAKLKEAQNRGERPFNPIVLAPFVVILLVIISRFRRASQFGARSGRDSPVVFWDMPGRHHRGYWGSFNSGGGSFGGGSGGGGGFGGFGGGSFGGGGASGSW